MTLLEKLKTIYPELNDHPEYFFLGVIRLQNDLDERGDYIAEWNYEKPQPTQEQLDALDDPTP